MLTDFYNI